jgi:hypothetical protein
MEAIVAEATTCVVTVNLAVVDPIGTVTEAGKPIDLDVEVSFTSFVPLAGLGAALSVTIPTRLVPPVTVPGVIMSALIWNGSTVSVQVWVTPP